MKSSLHSRILPALGTAVVCGSAWAGNIPQYDFQQIPSDFQFLQGATAVSNVFHEADEMLFAGDRQYLNPYTGEGFQIGFDFRYGGRTFNQFAIQNNGAILLGHDQVAFRGYSNLLFQSSFADTDNYFYTGMLPIMFGIKDGQLSYKTQGEAGSRTLTVEFAHMKLREPSTRGQATYSMQIVLHEADGTVDLNFLEEETGYANTGLYAGISGWGAQDRVLLTSPGLGEPISVSTLTGGDMTYPDSYISWRFDDELGYDHDDPYSYTLRFTPTGSEGFSCAAPTALGASQTGDVLTVSCDRPADAPATMILYSEQPFGADELPAEGVSYQVADAAGQYVTMFGNATLIYYGNDDRPTARVKDMQPSQAYYVKAFGVNGYPSYSTSTASLLEGYASHAAPTAFAAQGAGQTIHLSWNCPDQVMIAAATERVMTANEGPNGVFGNPLSTMTAGDAIPGGGSVIYVGPADEFDFQCEPNRLYFFRAWTLKDGRLSSTAANVRGISEPSLPYAPSIETQTLYETPMGWTSQTSNSDQATNTNFIVRLRGAEDEESAVAGISTSGSTAALISPTIPFAEGSVLSFEWAMETARDTYDPNQMVTLPEGNDPGVFGMGHSLKVSCGNRGTENLLYETDEYTGSMTPVPTDPDTNISGTSQWLPVSVALPEDRTQGRISFRFSTESFSILYLRNVEVSAGSGAAAERISFEADSITAGKGLITLTSALGGHYEVVSTDGRTVASLTLEAGQTAAVSLPAGIYIAGGRKMAVK